jgi:hypothetical protein
VRSGIAGLALAQIVAFVVLGWISGDAILRAIVARKARLADDIGLPERALGAVVGFVGLAIALMVGHLATGGAVFGTPVVVPVCGLAIAVTGVRRRVWPKNVPWAAVAAAILVLSLVFILPVIRGGTGVRTGDTPWHLGWSEQLLDGEPVPTGPAPEYGRNAYPWGFHAVIATMVRLVPGSDPLIAHEALHALLVLTIPLAAACLARRIHPRSGWAAAAAAGLIGGFGWMSAQDPEFILSPSLARYGADLVVASPNSMYELFPPALPRELGLVLLAAGGVALSLIVIDKSRRTTSLAGGLMGLAGLVSVPMFVMGLVWIIIGALALARGERLRMAITALVAALGVLAVWLAPVVANYIRFGGFVDVTPRLGVEWPLGSALMSWGLLLPLAVLGVAIAARARAPSSRIILAFSCGTLALLLVTIARGELDWDLGGNETLLHQGRVWPVAHLMAAAFAGVTLVEVFGWVARKSKPLAAIAVASVLTIGVASPAIASIHLTDVIATHDAGYLYRRDDFDASAFLPKAVGRLSSSDVVEVEGSNFLGLLLFSLSGTRLADYDDARLSHNDLRIRYADLARRWDARMAGQGFDPDYVAVRVSDAPPGADPILSGRFRDEEWVLLFAP